jgi:hypothetical protein
MKKSLLLTMFFLGTTSILFAQTVLKSEATGPIQFNTSGNDLQLQDNGNPVTLKFKNSTDPGTVLKLNSTGNFIINQKDNKNILFKTSGQEKMRLTPEGHVGVGLNNPAGMLEVKIAGANHAEAGIRVTAPAFFPGATITDPTIFEVKREKPTIPTSYWSYLKVDLDGNVGIGTASPIYRLHVHNPSTSSGSAIRTDAINGHIRLFETDNNPNNFTQIERNGGAFHIYQKDASLSSFQHVLTATMDGNVGIGTTNPQGYKLAVNGNVIAEEIRVKLHVDWPDFVFQDKYGLRSIEEVKNFIENEHHLPDVPSAKEVESNGISFG